MKKIYIAPKVGVIEFSAEHVIATSIKTGSGKVDAANALSNKREPAQNSWGSQNWSNDNH
jgi:hypothetical protein